MKKKTGEEQELMTELTEEELKQIVGGSKISAEDVKRMNPGTGSGTPGDFNGPWG